MIQPGAYHLNDAFRRRVVAVGFRQRFLAHDAEQQISAQRAVEQAILPRQLALMFPTLFHPLDGGLQQNRLRHGVVHQSHAQRLAGANVLAGQDHVQRFGSADQARQTLRAAGARQQAQLHFRQPERSFVIQ